MTYWRLPLSLEHKLAGRFRRRSLATFVVGLLAACLCAPSSVSAQQDADNKRVTVVEKVLVTEDGWQIAITYHSSRLGQNAPAVVLLHRLGGDRLVWEGKEGFAETLSGEGYAVISMDLRKHGQSKSSVEGESTSLRTADYQRMVDNDIEAVKEFLYKEHQNHKLNMRKTAIIAGETSAPIAINYAWYDWQKRPYPDGPTLESSTPRGQDIRALVLLSPKASIRGMPTTRAILDLRQPELSISVLTCVGALDEFDKGDAKKIYRKFSGIAETKDRMYLEASYPYKLRGTDLLRAKDVHCGDDILKFLKDHLMTLPDEWQDRQNRLTTK